MPATTAPVRRMFGRARILRLALVALLICSMNLAASPSSSAAAGRQVTQIASGGTINETLGSTLSISGDTLVMGAPNGFGTSQLTGLVRVFVRGASGWSEQATLVAPDGVYNDAFGAAVAVDGDTVVVGAPHHSGDQGAAFAGTAYVYTRSNGAWSLQATLIPNDRVLGGYDDWFGRVVAIAGDTLFVTSEKVGAGAVYVFTRSGAAWSQRAKLRSSDGDQYGLFGSGLAISQGTLLIGAPGDRAAYIFEQDSTGWVERQKLSPGSDPADAQRGFGQALAIDGDALVLGAPHFNTDVPPAAYVFTRSNGSWARRATLESSTDPESGSFGTAVAIGGGTIVVGAPSRHLDPDVPYWMLGTGAAHVFQGGGSSWSYKGLLSGDQLLSIGMFGAAVLAAGDTLIVGAPYSAGPEGSADGHVYTAQASTLTRAAADAIATPEDTPVLMRPLLNDTAGPAGSVGPSFIDLALLQRPRHGVASVNRIDGTLIYTPTSNFDGDDSFTYVAGWGVPASITVTVSPVPDPPAFSSLPPLAATERMPYTYRVAAGDPDPGDKLTFSASTLPAWLTLQDNGDGTAVLTGTAALADVGTNPISLSVRDGIGLSSTQAFTIAVKPFLPAAPTGMTARVLSRSQVLLNWRDASVDEWGFWIERRADGGAWLRVALAGENATSAVDANQLTCNTRYDYHVVAHNANGSSASNEDTVTIADCTLDAPTGLVATAATTRSLVLSWQDRSDNEAGFTIERSADGSVWQTLAENPPNLTYYADADLSCGPGYHYRVRAFNPGGQSDPTNTIRASVCPPGAPTNLSAVPAAQNGVALTWSDNSDNEAGFRVELSTDGGTQWHAVAVASPNATSTTVGGLTCGTVYLFRVKAYGGAGSAVSAAVSGATAGCSVIYVDASAANGGNGSSWASAYIDLQQALAATANRPDPYNVQIWVAAGTYKPTAGTDRAASFRLVNSSALYGGFAGDETTLEQRDWRAHPTILSGDIGVPADRSDNSYHVVMTVGAADGTLIDGFTITAGNANGSVQENKSLGGGMFNYLSSPNVRNMIFLGNSAGAGGGMANAGDGWIYVTRTFPLIDHVLFFGNTAGSGGGMSNTNGGSPTVVDAVFSGNRASSGGAIDNYWDSSPTLINATFSNNQATSWGGAIANSANSRPAVRNSIFWGNNGMLGGPIGQIYDTSSNSAADVSDSLLQTYVGDGIGVGGVRNRIADPLFVDADGADNIAGTPDDDLRLQSESPGVDAGNNTSLPAAMVTDIAGQPRYADHRNKPDIGIGLAPIVDIGAYEYQPPPAPHAAPTNLAAAATSRVGIALSWNDNSADEQGFKLERQDSSGVWSELARLPANTTTYDDIPLPCGTTYSYRVRAFNPGGDTDTSASAQATTDACIPRTFYVDQRATGANDGSSWADAYTDLQSALVVTTIRGDQIWMAAGVYKPSPKGEQSATFRLIPGVPIYGGFAGGEATLDQREPAAHTTVLSGDLRGDDPPGAPSYNTVLSAMSDNSYHVVTAEGADPTTVLDGLTIAGGNSSGSPSAPQGGGMLNRGGNPTIRNVTFRNNAGGQGAGIANLGGAPTFADVVFSQNHAGDGGGMYNQASNPALERVVFRENTTYAGEGAGMYNLDSSPTLHDVTFSLNDSYWGAGGMNNRGSSPTLTDVTFDGNQGDMGGMSNIDSSPTLRRVVFRNNHARHTIGGGGMYNGNSSPNVIDTVFVGNRADQGGGGMYNYGGAPTLVNVVFAGNMTSAYGCCFGGGGAMLNIESKPTLANVIFDGNHASNSYHPYGGAIANYLASSPTLVNVTFTRNSAEIGGAIYSTGDSRPTIRNSILWDNSATQASEISDDGATTDARFSIIAGGWAGQGNQSADPRFADVDGPDGIVGTLDDDLRLTAGSPAIDAGENAALPSDRLDIDGDGNTIEPLPLDLSHSPRLVDGTGSGAPIVDLGASERQQSQPQGQNPQLTINYADGRPGSTFLITGKGWVPNTWLRVVNDNVVIGELASDAAGAFTFSIDTLPQAIAGHYRLVLLPAGAALASQPPAVAYVLDTAAPLRARTASDYILPVPLMALPEGWSAIFVPFMRR